MGAVGAGFPAALLVLCLVMFIFLYAYRLVRTSRYSHAVEVKEAGSAGVF